MSRSKPLHDQFQTEVLEQLADGPKGFMRLWTRFRVPYSKASATKAIQGLIESGRVRATNDGKYALPEPEFARQLRASVELETGEKR